MIPTRSRSSTRPPDLITNLLASILSSLLPSDVNVSTDDVALIFRQISLTLVGVIILSSIRTVLRGATRVGQPCTIYSQRFSSTDTTYL